MHVSLRKVGRAGLSALAVVSVLAACLPDSEKDFEAYAKRSEPFNRQPADGGGGFDAEPPPTQAEEGTYYAACLSFLASGQTDRVFNFYAKTSFVPVEGGGGTLSLTLQALALDPTTHHQPATVSEAGLVGDAQASTPPAGPNVDASGHFKVAFGNVRIPADANPISLGKDVLITNAGFEGRYSAARSCAELSGDVTEPLQITLSGPKNICILVPIKFGDPTPMFDYDKDFAPGCL